MNNSIPSMVNGQWSIRGRRWFPYLIIIAIYGACTILVDPRGEFPLNDDWSYARSAFRFASENVLVVDEWCAPTLLGQAFYGGMLTKVFGPSFFALRLSTLVLSCGLTLILWKIFSELGLSRAVSQVAVLSWIFSPVYFSLSFTFMTEIPFLFFAALGLYLMARYFQTGTVRFLIGAGFVLGYAAIIRQTAALYIVASAIGILLWQYRERSRLYLGKTALFVGASLPFLVGYCLWLMQRGDSTAAARRKFELLRQVSSEQLIGNFYGLLFYTSFLLLPLVLWLTPTLYSYWSETGKRTRTASLLGWLALSISGLWWFHAHYGSGEYFPSKAYHGRMPFLLNVMYDTGLGPLTLDPTYYDPVPTPMYPGLWMVVTFLVAAGLVILGLLCTLAIPRLMRQRRNGPMLLVSAVAFLLVALFEIVFSHLQEGGLFDRHILSAALSMTVVLGLLHRGAPVLRTPPILRTTVWLLVAALAYFSVAATGDYLKWNRLRWNSGNDLLAQKIDPLTIAGGFEFNAWHNYDTFRARGNIEKVYHWWYDERTYLISMTPEPGYRVVRQSDYFSWLHRRPIWLYLLKKAE